MDTRTQRQTDSPFVKANPEHFAELFFYAFATQTMHADV
jgi:transcriptional regulator of met regulon